MSDYGIGEMPTGSGAAEEKQIIGPPKEAAVPHRFEKKVGGVFRNLSVPIGPPMVYTTGDEWMPARRSPAAIADLQRQMVDAGILKPNGFALGVWDVNSAQAYKEVLAASNASGTMASQTLNRMKLGAEATGAVGPTRDPLVVTLSHPDDIRLTAQEIAVRTIGRRITDEEANAFVGAFQNLQRTYQEQVYAASGSGMGGGPGGTVTEPPDLKGYAAQRIKAERPQEAAEMGYLNRQSEFFGLLDQAGGLASATGSNG